MLGPNTEPPQGNYPASPHPTPHQIKSYHVSETKILLKRYLEIYRHLLSKCFKNAVLERQEMVHAIFFRTANKNMIGCKICKVRNSFGCVAGAYYFQCQVS